MHRSKEIWSQLPAGLQLARSSRHSKMVSVTAEPARTQAHLLIIGGLALIIAIVAGVHVGRGSLELSCTGVHPLEGGHHSSCLPCCPHIHVLGPCPAPESCQARSQVPHKAVPCQGMFMPLQGCDPRSARVQTAPQLSHTVRATQVALQQPLSQPSRHSPHAQQALPCHSWLLSYRLMAPFLTACPGQWQSEHH